MKFYLEQQTVLKRPSRIPVSTRLRSPSPPVVIYKKPQHRSLDDLRWYCLARKFSILWQKYTFGCHLRRIKFLYQQKLIRKYFLLWKNNQYDSIAIEYYHKKLLKTYFHLWLSFLTKTQIAIEFLNHKRMKNMWIIWKIQLNKKHLHQQQYQIANEQYHRKILSHVNFSLRINFKFIYFFYRFIINGKLIQMNDKKILKNVYELIIIIVFIYKRFVLMVG